MNFFIAPVPPTNNSANSYKTVDTLDLHFPDDINDTSTDYSSSFHRAPRREGGETAPSSKIIESTTIRLFDDNDSSFFNDYSSSVNPYSDRGDRGTAIPLLVDNGGLVNNMTDDYDYFNNRTCDFQKHDWLEEKFFLISICGTTIAILGIFGNVTTALVLTRPAMRSPNNLYLTTLAIFDTCLLMTAILLYSVEYICEYTDNLNLYVTWLSYVPVVYALSHIAQTGSVYVTVAVTIERYIAVVHPDRSKIFCTQKGAGSAIFWVFCFSVLFNCTKFFELEVLEIENCTGFAAHSLEPSFLQSNDLYMTVYSLWITQITMVFAPFLVLFVFNTIIAVTIRKSFKRLRWVQHGPKRNELKEKSKEATYVLIVIVLIFLICNSPGFVISLMERIYGATYLATELRDFYTFMRESVNFLTIVNSSINFVIYCIFGKDFRKELVHIYGCHGGLTIFVPMEDKFTALRFSYRYSDDENNKNGPLHGRSGSVVPDTGLFGFTKFGLWFHRRFANKVVSHRDPDGEHRTGEMIYTNENTINDSSHIGNGCVVHDDAAYDGPAMMMLSSSSDSKAPGSITDNPLSLFLPTVVVSTASTSGRSSRNSSPSVTIFYSDDNVTWL